MDQEFLDMLICPKCKSDVKVADNKVVCQNAGCGLRYPIKDGIPIMLIDEAEGNKNG